MKYTNYSGGAKEADTVWDELGQAYGVTSVHFRPEDYHRADKKTKDTINEAVRRAAVILGKNIKFREKGYVIDLVRRNWFQAFNAEAIFAIGKIIEIGVPDDQIEGMTDRQGVAGGTGWAVEFAIQMEKPIYVFDQPTGRWYQFKYNQDRFTTPMMEKGYRWVPPLTFNFAGIGTRQIEPIGIKAIQDVYDVTFNLSLERK